MEGGWLKERTWLFIFVWNVDVSSTYGTSTGALGYRLGFELGYWGSKISKPLGFKPPRKTISWEVFFVVLDVGIGLGIVFLGGFFVWIKSEVHNFSSWWQLKNCLSSPRNLGKMNPILLIFFRWVGASTTKQFFGCAVAASSDLWGSINSVPEETGHLVVEVAEVELAENDSLGRDISPYL